MTENEDYKLTGELHVKLYENNDKGKIPYNKWELKFDADLITQLRIWLFLNNYIFSNIVPRELMDKLANSLANVYATGDSRVQCRNDIISFFIKDILGQSKLLADLIDYQDMKDGFEFNYRRQIVNI